MYPSPASPPVRVLHICQPVDGGVARVVAELAAAQAAAGLRVHVACPPESPLARSLDALPGVRVRPWTASRSPGRTLPSEVRGVRRVVDAVAPDLVHAHSAKAGLAARLALRGAVPTVFQPHAWSFEAADGVTGLLARRWERAAARWSARIVCVSEAEWVTGRRAGIDGRYTVVPNGVDPERFAPADRAAARERLLPPGHPARNGAPLVVCVGRLCRQKGQDLLLEAWPSVTDRFADAQLVLVGDGPEAAPLRARAGRPVTFAGAVADAGPWYQAADVVVLPSRWEGMALAPLEAMACARPVVITDVNGARESLPLVDRERCLVPPENPRALARSLIALLADGGLRDELGARGRRHVLTRHDAERSAEAVTAVYRELLGTVPLKNRECTTT
ncbi:glycosyltransferase family 4 protein [Streptomyces sp. NPDC087300]|uniref:glycosyltransferase family 4 protein n=1 Tax=Streptomyces sp. NPDC087300 TaxID=3365780 RepID=UPI00382336F2